MNRLSILLITLLILVLLSSGCQGSGSDPVTAGLPGNSVALNNDASVHQCLGYYSLIVDKINMTAEVLPLRAGTWHFNLTGVLNSTMGIGVVGVPGEADPLNGLFVFDITLTHPFETSPQLAGFDVKGILMAPGTLGVGALMFSDADETRLENADGFTRWWNPTEFTTPGMFGYTEGSIPHSAAGLLTATVNPYKLHCDILEALDSLAFPAAEPLDSDTGRAVFTAGSANTRRYYIRFPLDPGPQAIFGYAVDCSWNPPVPNPPAEVPDDFPMNANQPEPWRVSFQPVVNTLYYDADAVPGGVGGGVLRLQANIHDWQGQAAGNNEAEIAAVQIYAPDLMASGVDAVFVNETETKARYSVDLTGLAEPSDAGEVQVICRVESAEGNYTQAAAVAPDEPISSFMVLTLDIPDPECAVDANNDWLEAVDVASGDVVTDQVCLPDDYRDFFAYDVPIGNEVEGSFDLYCDAEPTTLGLYTSDQTLIAEADVAAGYATISVDSLDLVPDDYYLRVLTSNSSQVAPYLLEINAALVSVSPNLVDVTPADLYIEPQWPWLHEDILYLVGRGIWTFDMSDPSNPVYLGGQIFREFNYMDDAAFNYPYCYFAYHLSMEYSNLCLIDFSDPSDPIMTTDLYTFHEEARELTMNSTHIYAAMDLSIDPNLRFLDYSSDPLSPVEVGSYLLDEQVNDLELIDPEGPDTQLVVGIVDRLLFLGVEDPSSVTHEGTVSLFLDFLLNDLVVDGNFIYVVDDNGSAGWLDIFEQTDTGPIARGSELLLGTAEYIDVAYPYAYVGDDIEGLAVVDVSIPDTPNHIASAPTVNYAERVATGDDYVCVLPNQGTVQTFDVTVPAAPTAISRIWSVNDANTLLGFSGDYLYVADSSPPPAIDLIDISDPASAEIISEFLLPDWPNKMALGGDVLAYSHYDWVRCVDVSDPFDMQIGAGEYNTPDNVDLIVTYDHYAYAMYNDVGDNYLQTIDIADYNAPTYVTTRSWDDSKVRDVAFYGEVMYIPTADAVRIYELTSPGYPNYLGSYAVADQINDVEIQGHYLYIFMYMSSLVEVLDLTVPINPTLAGSGLNGTTNSRYMALDGQYAYFAGNLINDIHAALIYPPGTVSPLGVVYSEAFQCNNIYIDDGYLYQETQGRGVSIFDLY